MTPEKKPSVPSKPKVSRAPNRPHSSREKAEAVLAIWTEKRRPAAVARELGVNWQVLQTWQSRALMGMLEALESRVSATTEKPPTLSRRLRQLLDRQTRREQAAKEAKAATVPEVPSPRAATARELPRQEATAKP
jgi:transposase-like protein